MVLKIIRNTLKVIFFLGITVFVWPVSMVIILPIISIYALHEWVVEERLCCTTRRDLREIVFMPIYAKRDFWGW